MVRDEKLAIEFRANGKIRAVLEKFPDCTEWTRAVDSEVFQRVDASVLNNEVAVGGNQIGIEGEFRANVIFVVVAVQRDKDSSGITAHL